MDTVGSMDKLPDRDEHGASEAARELARLQAQIEEARGVLSGLQHDMADAQRQLSDSQAVQLLEANEQLVLAALRAQEDAEAAARALSEVSHLAEFDALTQLPNRVLLRDRLGHAIAAAKRHGSRFALLFIDLDGFKHINDTLGHAVGDRVLKRVAQCLTACVREEDTVSRHGGDEFLVLLANVAHAGDAALVANKMMAGLAVPDRMERERFSLRASIGISLYPDDGDDAETLIDRADAAMYRAKRHGSSGYAVHGKEVVGKYTRPKALCKPPAPTRDKPVKAGQKSRYGLLREANEQLLLSALGARDLQAAAEQAQRRQAEFTALLAHELRNPLAPIRTAAALLGRIGLDEPLLLKARAVIERQVLHLSRLISDLLEVSYLNAGRLRLERQRIDMCRVVEDAVEVSRPAMDVRRQHLSVELPADALEVQGDPARLVQIVGNLLANASKYTPDSGKICVSAEAAGDAVVLAVSDSGIGIAPEALPTVFEPFVRDARAVGFHAEGLGVGLTVVRELIRAHGGSVVASSGGLGLGSRFTVTLPLAGAADAL